MQTDPQIRQYLKELKIPRSKPEWLGEIFAVAGLLANIIVVAIQYRNLPETIATHFSFSGTPDGFSSKTMLLGILGISVAIYLLMTFFATKPQYYSFSVRITVENAARQYRLVRGFLLILKVMLAWVFFHLTYTVIQVALARQETLGIGLIIFLAMFILILPIMLIASYKLR